MAALDTSLERDQETLERVLCECADFYAGPPHLRKPQARRTLRVFDRERGQFLLMDEGWEGYKHVDQIWVHVELRDGRFWIQQDGTQDGIALDLLAAGVPKDRIVLAFHHPSRWKDTEFAAG